MENVKKTIYYYYNAKYESFSTTEYNFWSDGKQVYSSSDYSGVDTYYLIDSKEVEFQCGDFDLNFVQIEGLEAMLKRDMADSQVRQDAMRQRIAELKCIGHEPVEAPYGGTQGDISGLYEPVEVPGCNWPSPCDCAPELDPFDDDIPF